MKPKQPFRNNNPKSQLLLDTAGKRVKALHEQGHYQEALDICLQITRSYPSSAGAWSDAASNAIQLGRWQDAVRYAQTALARGSKALTPLDALAQAYGHLKQWDDARRHGLRALEMRDRRFGGEPPMALPSLPPLPPLPSPQTRDRNVIAFSLFGGNSKYCEPAVLNVQEQPRVYPHWVCRFYVDASVPQHVIDRLQQGGGQVVCVDGAAAQWPGPMWRFLALSDPQVDRVLFRDADSVISQREAGAVEEWLTSGKRFHIMRDWGSHTELMMAGLWGAVNGSLPPLDELMQRFMSAPLESVHFADQYFLRKYVWPYARASLMQHDSVFGFMDAVPFPVSGEERSENFHVGYTEGSPFFTATSSQPNGSAVTWELYASEPDDDGQVRERLICAYPATVKDGAVRAHIPARYARRLEQGTARVRLVDSGAAS